MHIKARLVAGAVLVGLWMLGSAATAGTPEMALWVASESWPGGTQHDARLGRTVQFWGAGIALRDVFAGIQEQTGAEIGFWPAGDVNERVCVNLYLNPERPPTLRQVMAQLSWATDCSFGYWVEGEEARYSLLKTSIGEGIVERLREAPMEAHERDYRRSQQMLERMPARREALREALSLDRKAAIRRYRGKDDLLLLAALDPTRRAMAELYLTLPAGGGAEPMTFPLSDKKFSELTEEQQACVRNAVREPLRRWLAREREGGQTVETGPDEVAWLESLDRAVSVSLSAGPEEMMLGVSVYGDLELPDLQLEGEMVPEARVALREALGERVSQEERQRLTEEYSRERLLAERRRWMEEQIGRVRLSAETERLLASVDVPVRLDGTCALWEIEEMVARASGLHVVSDCFWQPERPLREFAEALYPGEKPPVTALMAVRLATLSEYDRAWLQQLVDAVPSSVGWEWREAGAFLSFRSMDADVWRGAFLPEDALELLDRWVEPHLVGMGDGQVSVSAIEIEPDWRAFGRLLERLDVVQLKFGGHLTYGDPSDERYAWRQAFRVIVMRMAWGEPWLFRFIGSLSDAQWERLKGEGLLVGADIGVEDIAERWEWREGEQIPHEVLLSSDAFMAERPGGWVGFEEGDVLRVQRRDKSGTDAVETWEMELVREGRVVDRFSLPVGVRVVLGDRWGGGGGRGQSASR